MKKILIQFKESEYQIYHNYCHSYYTIYDTTRKQSIQLFIDLFEKDMLPLEEHNLKEVSSFFSKNSDELLADSQVLGEDKSLIDLHQLQVSKDIQFLIQDFEKIYRLIEKTGIESNYVLILAMFSKIIEEEKNANSSAIDEQDRKTIDFFAPEIADNIRTRLGSDAGWEMVLYELTRIVRKFNLASPHQKISQNAIFILGSAMVAHINSDVGAVEIQSTLKRYFEESELTEFESRLNDTPDLPFNDTDSGISFHVIFDALVSISSREIDPESHDTVTDPELLKTAGIPPGTSPSVISRNSEIITPPPEGTFTQYLKKIQNDYFSRFAIGVSDTEKSLVVMPEKRERNYRKAYKKAGIPNHSLLLVLGFTIFILFAITIGLASGIWNPVKIMDNTNTAITSNVSSPVKILDNTSSAITRNLLSPVKILDNTSTGITSTLPKASTLPKVILKTPLTSEDINKNFMRIAFGSDNVKIKKSSEERIVISLMGEYDENDAATISQFTGQFNNNSYTNKISVFMKTGDEANIIMYFLPQSSMKNIEGLDGTVVSTNPQTDDINYLHRTVLQQTGNQGHPIKKDYLYINSDLKGDPRTHWTLRGLLYDLGFVGETNDYPDSIFYGGSDTITQLSQMDVEVIQLMYGQKITSGMSFDRVKSLLLV